MPTHIETTFQWCQYLRNLASLLMTTEDRPAITNRNNVTGAPTFIVYFSYRENSPLEEEVKTTQQPMTWVCIRSEIYTFAQVAKLEKRKKHILLRRGELGKT
jgi:hypothetical protein